MNCFHSFWPSVPHTRSTQVQQLQVAVATLARPLSIPAEDDEPVDVFFLIVGPLHERRLMLQSLSRLVRLVKHTDVLSGLRRAKTPTQMKSIIAAAEQECS